MNKQLRNLLIELRAQEKILRGLRNRGHIELQRKKVNELEREYNYRLGKKLRFLHNLMEKLFCYYPIKPIKPKEVWTDGNVVIYYERKNKAQAELYNTWSLPIDERIRLHLIEYKFYKRKFFEKKNPYTQKTLELKYN